MALAERESVRPTPGSASRTKPSGVAYFKMVSMRLLSIRGAKFGGASVCASDRCAKRLVKASVGKAPQDTRLERRVGKMSNTSKGDEFPGIVISGMSSRDARVSRTRVAESRTVI